MRKYVSLALICILSVFTLVGCGNSTTTEQKSASTESSKSSESTESFTPSAEEKSSNDEVKTLKISGTFYNEANKDYYTFNSDGSVLIFSYYTFNPDDNALVPSENKDEKNKMGVPGQFVQNDKELVIYVGETSEENKEVYNYTYDGKTLILKNTEDGEVLTLVKEEK